MSRLRPLTESECYTRLYGDRENTVTVLREDPDAPRPAIGALGEHLRRLFEEPLDGPDELPGAEAA